LVLNREAAENVRRPGKAVSPTFFNTIKGQGSALWVWDETLPQPQTLVGCILAYFKIPSLNLIILLTSISLLIKMPLQLGQLLLMQVKPYSQILF
jgi:hypothetical protein